MHRRHGLLTALMVALILVGCRTDPGSSLAPSTLAASPSESTEASSEPSASAQPSTAPEPDASQEARGSKWTEAARFDDPGLTMVIDITAWSGGFMAIGERWPNDNVAMGIPTPQLWTSADGRTWSAAEPAWGTTNVEPRGILSLAGGGVTVIGVRDRYEPESGQTPRAAAWTSTDGTTWTEIDVPFGADATTGLNVASGPIGHVVTTSEGIWYSAEGTEWDLVHDTPEGVGLFQPVAGDEGFVIPATELAGDSAPMVFASGDGIEWVESRPPTHLGGVAAFGGDWLATGYTDDPPAISVLTSANGLEWSVGLDVDDLLPAEGPRAGPGMETDINQVTLAGEGRVLVMTMGWNHCCAQPAAGIRVFTSTDASNWVGATLPSDAFVTAAATDGSVAVIGGYVERGAAAVFWVADR